eukprot:16902-Heterococcus_DN1.PRE.2
MAQLVVLTAAVAITVLTSAFAASIDTVSAATTSKATATTAIVGSGTDTMNQLAAVACDVSDTVWSAAPDAVMVHDESSRSLTLQLMTTTYISSSNSSSSSSTA